MSTSMSSRREYVAPAADSSFSIIALLVGVGIMVAGAVFDLTTVAVVGFGMFVLAFIYLNSMFWARKMDNKVSQRTIDNYKYWI